MKTIITITPNLSISLVTTREIETRVYLVVKGVECFHSLYDHASESALEGHLEAIRRYYSAEVQARIVERVRSGAYASEGYISTVR